MSAYGILRKLLFLVPPEAAHTLAVTALRLGWPFFRRRVPELPVTVAGITFPNPIGLAAGFDKDAVAVPGLYRLGFGFVEVGTVTPRPQPGNPRPRLFRRPPDALVNRMGFNNAGAEAVARRLARLGRRPAPLGVNVGKNKDTPIERATDDYVACATALAPAADYLVVNASSPNTPGLRSLQAPAKLAALLGAVRAVTPVPMFVKIGPDLAPEDVDEIVEVAVAQGARAIIATNTIPLPEGQGGLSGAPLAELSTAMIRRVFRRAAGRLDVVGVGGVFTAEDAYAKIRAGASLVQVYTGFVYEGPSIARNIVTGLTRLFDRDGFATVAAAVGIDSSS